MATISEKEYTKQFHLSLANNSLRALLGPFFLPKPIIDLKACLKRTIVLTSFYG